MRFSLEGVALLLTLATAAASCSDSERKRSRSRDDGGEGGEDPGAGLGGKATSGAGSSGRSGSAGSSNGVGGTAGVAGGAQGGSTTDPEGGEAGEALGAAAGSGAEGGSGTSQAGNGGGGSSSNPLCGNGELEAGEACDRGVDNGLYFGDGAGCTRTCTPEPVCRDNSGVSGACNPSCGDGNREGDEECDDANRRDGDGCSSECSEEAGFTCEDEEWEDTRACTGNAAAQCINLGIAYRDFDPSNQAAGHPDFFYLSPSTPCVPDASGRTATSSGTCTNNDSTPLCQGIAASSLGSNGKPALGGTAQCACRYTDWDATGLLTGVSGSSTCTDSAGNLHPFIQSTVPIVQSDASFAEWYTDSARSTRVISAVELAPVGQSYQFFSSGGRTVNDDLHDLFMGVSVPAQNGAPANTLSSGFFPLEGVPGVGSTEVCNLWPYFVVTGSCVAAEGNPVTFQWDPSGSYTPGMAGTGGPVTPVTGNLRNFYFTSEVHYYFRYEGAAAVSFRGDDDAWVFINGRLVLDLGGTHSELLGTATLSGGSADWSILSILPDGSAAPPSSGGSGTIELGLETGKTYEIAVFHADRHPRDSNYGLTLPRSRLVRSVCTKL